VWPEDGGYGCEAVEWSHEQDDWLCILSLTYDFGLKVFIVKMGQMEANIDCAYYDGED
jgi:hypothetical protein